MTATLHQTAPIGASVINVSMTDIDSKAVSDKSPNCYFLVNEVKVWIETVNPVPSIHGVYRFNLTTKLPANVTAGATLNILTPNGNLS